MTGRGTTAGSPAAVLQGLARAFGGALLFAMPLLMTMELWRLAVAVDRWRLALLLVATVALVLGLARTFGGLTGANSWGAAAVDTGVAMLVGAVAAALVLTVLSVVHPLSSWRDATSVVALETLPAAIGASYARAQLGEDQGGPSRAPGYRHQLFLMSAGAVVFASSIAPTEEVVLLAARLTELDALLLALLSVALMHGFVYALGFKGGEHQRPLLRSLLGYTLPGYALALAISGFLLWTFGRYDDIALLPALVEAVVLALPASLGAAAARLIL